MANDNGGGFTTGLLVGGILGTIVGIMIAPKSGSETRMDLVNKSEYLKDHAENFSSTVVEKLSPTISQISDKLAPTFDKVVSSVTPLVDQVNSKMSDSRGTKNNANSVSEDGPTNATT